MKFWIIGIVLVVVAVILIQYEWGKRLARNAARPAPLARAFREEKERERERVRREEAALRQLSSNCARTAVQTYKESLEWLQSADRQLGAAEVHHSNRAYTPFWEACERSLLAASQHRACIDRISEVLENHRQVTRRLAAYDSSCVATSNELVDKFQQARSIAAGDKVAARLNGLVYRAQQDYPFAAIFEQRRTTAAVVSGFKSLTDAFAGMSQAISGSYQCLSTAANSFGLELENLHRSIGRSSEVVRSNQTVQGQLEEVNRNLRQIAHRRQ